MKSEKKNYVFLNGLGIGEGVMTLLWIDMMDTDVVKWLLSYVFRLYFIITIFWV